MRLQSNVSQGSSSLKASLRLEDPVAKKARSRPRLLAAGLFLTHRTLSGTAHNMAANAPQSEGFPERKAEARVLYIYL